MRAVFIPGLLSDARVWAQIAADFPMPTVMGDVTRDDTITGMAQRLLDEYEGNLMPVGHSMGARVAMDMARLAPSRIKALVLADTGHAPLGEGELVKREEMIALGRRDMEALMAAWLPPMVGASHRRDARLMQNLTEMVRGFLATTHERQIRALISRPNATKYLPEISCPTLLLVGSEDQWSPVEQHKVMAASIPNARLEVITGAGHFLPIENAPATRSAIHDWMDSL